jgi:triosephosphate isomerase
VKYVLANWKMYPSIDESVKLLEDIQSRLRERFASGGLPRVIVCPPYVALAPMRDVVDTELVHLGAQNCHWEAEGAYTGEISPTMLRGLVDYVCVGHSERRAFGETDEQFGRKVAAVAEARLVPVLFVGEDDRGGEARSQSEERLRQGLANIDPATQPFLLVYEPTWAVGGDETASPEHVAGAVAHLKAVAQELGAAEPAVIYGGSVNESNMAELAELDVLDGLGAARASLDAGSFLPIIEAVGEHAED